MLRQRLTDPTRPPWATVDVDGHLLLSTDRARLEQLLGNQDGRYRSFIRDDRWVLAYRNQANDVTEGWLEPNPDNPQRPLASFVVQPAAGPSAMP
jgi:hypothetical protein